MKILALALFILTYLFMLCSSKKGAYIAFFSALIYILLGIMPMRRIFASIDWNVLMMLAGMMGTVFFFIESKMPHRLADIILSVSSNVMWAAVSMSLFAGAISAFIDNVATVLMIAPIGLTLCRRLKISPVVMLILISVSSNLQGAATLVGDTTSIMLGSYAKMDFWDFIFMNGRPGIFWAVELGALCTIPVVMLLYRKRKRKIESPKLTEVEDYFPTFLLLSLIFLLIGISFIPGMPEFINGFVCMAVFLIGLIRSIIKNRGFDEAKRALREMDGKTLLLLGSLSIVIKSLVYVGIIDEIAHLFVLAGGKSLFAMYTLIVFGSVLMSAFIDNIPYVATMLPVVTGISTVMGCDPCVLYFGLLTGATLGGNLTPIGASANIAAIGILEREKYKVRFSEFMKIGVPFTLTAVTAGYLFIWFVWS